MGVFAAAQAVSVSMAPLAGGVLLATLGWRWVFWPSILFALAARVIGWLSSRRPLSSAPIDA